MNMEPCEALPPVSKDWNYAGSCPVIELPEPTAVNWVANCAYSRDKVLQLVIALESAIDIFGKDLTHAEKVSAISFIANRPRT